MTRSRWLSMIAILAASPAAAQESAVLVLRAADTAWVRQEADAGRFADVAVDGELVGHLLARDAPLAVRPGLHHVVVTMLGYTPFSDTVRVEAGARVLVTVRLGRGGPVAVPPPAGPFAQAPSAARTGWALWLTTFVGPAAFSDSNATSSGLAVTYQRSHFVASTRAQFGWSGARRDNAYGPEFGEAALLFGYGTRAGGRFHASVATGIGVSADDQQSGVGLPFEVQLNWRPTRFLGAGLYGWANSAGPAYGVAAAVHLGRLR